MTIIYMQKKRSLFILILLIIVFSTSTTMARADGEQEELVTVYSEDSETGAVNDTETSEDVKEAIEPEFILPEPQELFGENAYKIDSSRSLLTYSWRLAMVKSEEIIDTVKSILEKAISAEKVSIVENKARNTILAIFPDKKDVATRKEWADVMGVIDSPIEQVLIEVNIVELILNDIEQKGGQLRSFADADVGSEDLFQSFNVSHTANPMEVEEKAVEGFKYFITNGNKLKALLFSGKDRNKTKLLSSPQLIASNHKAATFKLGQTLPIITGSTVANGVTTYSFENKDVGINLNFTPHFCGKGFINLDVNQEVNDLIQYDDVKKVAIFAHKTLTSNVTLKSGETAALGGYIHDKNRLNRKNSPALRKIPFIGKYLNRDMDTSEKVEVVVFITPKILRSNDQIKFNQYAEKARFERRKKMVQKLDKDFDDCDIGKRSQKRLSKKQLADKRKAAIAASKKQAAIIAAKEVKPASAVAPAKKTITLNGKTVADRISQAKLQAAARAKPVKEEVVQKKKAKPVTTVVDKTDTAAETP
ncbi:MAG: hypothetical protein A2W80_11570 [Candidatus Riflebacteria bacterium GWC2_50_8]|nr:MAG: hypothetical protein A2W80_11570 [Candidatus Riflebacteria bacterium GWC2_50_8]